MMQEIAICAPSHNLSGYIFATKARTDNRKKVIKQQYLPHMSLQYGELRPTSGWDRFVSLGHPSKFQRVSRLGSVTAQPNCSVEQRAPRVFDILVISLVCIIIFLLLLCQFVSHSSFT